VTLYKTLLSVLLHEMGGAFSAYGGDERRIQCLDGETWWKETTGETQA